MRSESCGDGGADDAKLEDATCRGWNKRQPRHVI